MIVLKNLVICQRLIYKLNFQNKILRPFTSSCIRYNDTSVNGFDEANLKEVYNGPLSTRIRAVKLLSLVTSMGGLFAQPMVLQKASEVGTHIAVVLGVSTFIGFFTFVTPILLHLITKKYVRTIHYNPQTKSYTAKTYTLFLQDKVVVFKPEDVDVPDVPGMFTSFNAKGVPLFVESSKFNDMSHYKTIMGYDKPINFKLNDTKKTS